MIRRILHANDGSQGALRALDFALDLAKKNRTELHMVTVEEMPRMPGNREEVIGEEELANRKFEELAVMAKGKAKTSKVKLTPHLLVGHPVQAIAEFIDENGFDTLVIGYVGHSQLYEMLIGGTAERLVRLAPCTVIVVK